jgi:sugar phosphate isomerase/epimerase
MRIAGSTFSFGDITLEESLQILADLGFDLADVGAGWSNYHQVLPQEAVDDPSRQADRVRQLTQQFGIELSELFIMHFGQPINHPDAQTRLWTRGMFTGIAEFARLAGFESLMMIPGHVHVEDGQSTEQAFALSVEELRWMVAAAGERELQCNIEPCAGSIAHHPDDAVRLCESVPGLGLTVDYAHQVQLGLGHEQIEALHPYARHVHAKQSAPGTFQARPDEGAIDFPRLLRKLQQDGYDGVVSVEFVTTQDLIDAAWNMQTETARLKQILEETLASLRS